MKVAQVLSFSYFALSAILIVVLLVNWLTQWHVESPTTLITYLLIVSGNSALCLCVYILGAYVGRGYLEAKGRPPYILGEVIKREAPPDVAAAPIISAAMDRAPKL